MSSSLPILLTLLEARFIALILLTSLVFMDLSIPRLIERIIDQGILQQNLYIVIQTSLIMLGISLLSTLIAIGNNNLSVRVGESVARDIREALFVKLRILFVWQP